MRTSLPLLFILILLASSCSSQNSDQKKPIVDYQGKEMSEDEIHAFMEAEMNNFEALNSPRDISVKKIDNVKQAMPEWFKKDLRYRNIDAYNIDEKIIHPYIDGKLSAKEFLSIIDTLKDELKRSLPSFFTKAYYPKLKEDRAVLEKVLAIDKTLNKSEHGFLIRCTQQVDGYRKAIEDSIRSNTFNNKHYADRAKYLSRYAEGGDHKATLALLDVAVKKMPKGENLISYDEEYLNPFEFLMIHGDEAIRKETRRLLFEYVGKSAPTTIAEAEVILTGEISDEFKKVLTQKRAEVAANTDPDEKKRWQHDFNIYCLRPYARNFGMESLPYIEDLIGQSEHFYFIFPVLQELVRYNKLTDSEKQKLVDVIKKIDQHAPGSYISQIAPLMKALYPEKSPSEFAHTFTDEDNEWSKYWNQRKFPIDSLDYYLSYLKAIGFENTALSPKERYLAQRDNRQLESEWLIYSLLDHLGVALGYDCETGMWPNPYDELMADYLKICGADLKNYYALYQYKQLTKDYETQYTAMVTDGTTGFVGEPEDAGDWYDPVTVEAIFNRALKDNGVDKRFLQLATGDQTVFVIYCTPGQYKLLVTKFRLPLLGGGNEEY